MRVVGVFLEHDGKFVLLYRRAHKPDGLTWGLPSGKVEAGESDHRAAIRELFEETGYRGTEDQLEHLGDFEFVTTSGIPSTYGTYRLRLEDPHDVIIENSAHEKAIWVSIEEADKMENLIHGLHDLFRYIGFVK